MNAVSSNMWAGMGVIEEIERGTLNRFLTTPIARSAILNGTVIVQALTTAFQSAIIVLIGWAVGAVYPGGIAGPLALIVASMLLGSVFTALSTVFGLAVRQRESIIGMSIFLLLPLTFLSTAFMAKSLMPGWMQAIAALNPVNWALDAARGLLSASANWAAALGHGAALLALASVFAGLATLTFRSYQRTI
jgi:ABC-2 type transport system permease protein